MKKLSQVSRKIKAWKMSPEVSTKGLYFALIVPLACMIFLLEWEPRILIFVFLGYSSAVIGFLIARSSLFQAELLTDSDKQLRMLATNIGDLVILHRFEDNSNVFVSGSIEEQLGYQQDEIICKYDTFFIHPDDRKEIRSRLSSMSQRSSHRFCLTLRVLHKEGIYKWMEVNGKAAPDDKGIPTHAVLSFRDASDRIEIENATRHFAEELIRKTTESNSRASNLTDIASMMTSHDLKEPMRTIRNYINIIDSKYLHQLDATAQECVHFIKDGAERMSLLIEDVLTFSKLGVQGNTNQLVDINDVIKEVLQSIDLQVLESGSTISYEVLPKVKADRRQMHHLFQNLIDNAMKYRSEIAPVIQISWEKKNGSWEFNIRDNGIGIKKEFQHSVFDVFRRLHGVGQYEGSGIGLAICKRIVENHGGKLWVESDGIGMGSTFKFTIAVKQENDVPDAKIYQPASWSNASAMPFPKTIETN